MSRIFIPLLAALLAAGITSARPFTNTEGKTIEAEIVRATATSVILKLQSGKNATVKIATLSEPDQKFVKAWMANRVPNLRVTPKLIRANRDDERYSDFFFDEERQTQVLTMSLEIENQDSRVGLGETELQYILVGRSVRHRNEYKILAKQRSTFSLGIQQDHTMNFKTVKNTYDDGDYGKSGHRCIGYVLHAKRISDDREVYSFASTPALEKGIFNIINLKTGDITDENFIKPGKGGDGGNGIIVVE